MRLCPACETTSTSAGIACDRCGWSPPSKDGFPAYAPELDDTAQGFDPAHFSSLAQMEADNFWFRIRNKLIRRVVRGRFPTAGNVLEVGCGTGFVLSALAEELPNARLRGSELHTLGLAFAASRVPNAELLQLDARKIPFRDEFDLVCAFDVIEHIDADDLVLAQMYSALSNGGGILVTVPQHRALWSQQDVFASHERRYEPGELEEKMKRVGFRISYTTSFVALLYPALLLSRRGKRQETADFDAESEFRISRLLNTMLYAVMSIEYAMIAAGIRFPFGGSRLVAGIKE